MQSWRIFGRKGQLINSTKNAYMYRGTGVPVCARVTRAFVPAPPDTAFSFAVV
jgi:hypothetical protein